MSGTPPNGLGMPREPLVSRWRRTRYRRRTKRDDRRREAKHEAALRRLARRGRRQSRRDAAKKDHDRSTLQHVSVSLARRLHARQARRIARIESREPRTLLPTSWVKSWNLRRRQSDERRLEREARQLAPGPWRTRILIWRRRLDRRRTERESNRRTPGPWRNRWSRWRAGAPVRIERRRDIARVLIPRPIRHWWRRRRPEQRSRIRLALISSVLIAIVAFNVNSRLPRETNSDGWRLSRFNSTAAELAAFTGMIQPPALAVQQRNQAERILQGAQPAPRTQPELVCGVSAFESVLTSSRGSQSIGRVKCAGLYGIGEILSSNPNTAGKLGFFAVDHGGRWRLVATAPKGSLADSFPEGFPQRLVKLWRGK
ncbi:unannotated protein [freshwater metagenome]|uniref:Unannotated protein n=1 Tax=freshwater metagenome TaxID=449393 RepID=A0A6J7JX26_9ZZZZ